MLGRPSWHFCYSDFVILSWLQAVSMLLWGVPWHGSKTPPNYDEITTHSFLWCLNPNNFSLLLSRISKFQVKSTSPILVTSSPDLIDSATGVRKKSDQAKPAQPQQASLCTRYLRCPLPCAQPASNQFVPAPTPPTFHIPFHLFCSV